MYSRIQKLALQKPILFLIIIGVLVRVLIAICYSNQVSIFNDTESYIPLAERLAEFNLKGYNGLRTPGYPFLLTIAAIQFDHVVYIQALLGILSSILLFKTSLKLINHIPLALINGLSLSFFFHVLFYERAILTETLTLFALVVCLWYIVRIDFFKPKQKGAIANVQSLILGVLIAVVFLIRPMFIVITPLVIVCFLISYRHLKFSKMLIQVLLIAMPAIVSYQGWSMLNFQNTGYKSVTVFSGMNLAQSCVYFVDNASDTDAELRDLYVRKRDSVINANGNVPMSIWRVYEELKAKENITVAELSQRFDPMNKELIKNNPLAYSKQVGISWMHFWDEYILWNYSKFKHTIPKWVLSGTWLYVQRPLLFIINSAFLIISLLMIARRIRKKELHLTFYFFCILLILGSSLGQALVIYGNNGRFSFPFIPFIILVTSHFLYEKNFLKKIKRVIPNKF
ncbi:MAG: 4-amino-4-deoxy-L-arabinose transferase-like glycosyltransferase [Dokdonia sp.]|jgi:4-amino-4-deoxy-L-arabinose transferase-like glycosyltransferase